MSGLLEQMRGAELAAARRAMSHTPQRPVGVREMADAMQAAGLLTAPIPVVGDAVGLLGDAAMYAAKPEERTAGNAVMTALGVLPFVPAASATRTAMKAAQRKAAKSVASGGLGLPWNNTAAQRAEKLFPNALIHGTATPDGKPFSQFDVDRLGEATGTPTARVGVWSAGPQDQSQAARYAVDRANQIGSDYPLLLNLNARHSRAATLEVPSGASEGQVAATIQQAWDDGLDSLRLISKDDNGIESVRFVHKNPNQLRLAGAAFDPSRINENNLLASIAPYVGVAGLLGAGAATEQADLP